MDDRKWCISYLEKVNNVDWDNSLPEDLKLRALMNITMPINLSAEFYRRQDRVLQTTLETKKIIDVDDLSPIQDGICLFLGDITLLRSDAIVNAGNEKLLGCFHPLHSCVDNAIHSAAGLQVRRDLLKLMSKQGHDEKEGQVKVTRGYNLKATYLFHTVGPKVMSNVTSKNEEDLRNCYLSCLKKADELHLGSIAFCSIATGLYGFPIKRACQIAISCVKSYLLQSQIGKVVFDVFSKEDYETYYQALAEAYR